MVVAALDCTPLAPIKLASVSIKCLNRMHLFSAGLFPPLQLYLMTILCLNYYYA